MAQLAEQENRVKIPDGTAAVSAEGDLLGENRSLEQSGKAEEIRRGSNPPSGTSQKTYAVDEPSILCGITENALVTEKTAVALPLGVPRQS